MSIYDEQRYRNNALAAATDALQLLNELAATYEHEGLDQANADLRDAIESLGAIGDRCQTWTERYWFAQALAGFAGVTFMQATGQISGGFKP